MERYWKPRVELVSALKEGTTSSSLASPMLKIEQAESVFVVHVEGAFSSESRKNVVAFASTNTSSLIFSLSCYIPRRY